MNSLLVINGSPSESNKSYSKALTDLFLKKYHDKYPEDKITILDLNTIDMAQITLNNSNASTFFNETDSLKFIKQLKEANKVICVSPMNNFNISGLLKNYLDHVLLANETFSYKYSKKGDAIGLLPHLSVQIITTQGAPLGWYHWGNHTAYLEGTWKFVGAKINEPSLCLAGTKISPLKDETPEIAAKTLEEQINKALKTF